MFLSKVGGFTFCGGPDENDLTAVDVNGIVHIWDISSNMTERQIQINGTYPGSIALTSKGKLLVTGAGLVIEPFNQITHKFDPNIDPEPIRIWNLESGRQVGAAEAVQPVRGLAINPDETLIAAATGDKKILLFPVSGLSTPTVLEAFKHSALQVMFSPSGEYLAVAGDNKVIVFHIK